MSRGVPSMWWMTARTSSRLSTTGSRAGRLARTTSSSQGSSWSSTSPVEEEERAERLVLRGGGDVVLHGERAEEFRHFRPAHARRVALVVEQDEAADPSDVGLLGPPAEVPLAHRRADAVEEARRGCEFGHRG